MHKLRQVIQSLNMISTSPTASVMEAVASMTEGCVGAIPVLEGERLVGIFSERDLMTRVVAAGRDGGQTRIEEVMTREVVTAELDDSVDRCLEKMRGAGCRHLPVVEGERVISMLSMRDLLLDEIEEQTEEIRHLRAYIHQEAPV